MSGCVVRNTVSVNALAASGLLCIMLLCGYAKADEKADMAKLQREIEALQKELKEVQGTRTDLQKDLEKSEKQINELQKKRMTSTSSSNNKTMS
jgi:septal ring factor EnvC (AmiA/AmiB activator)